MNVICFGDSNTWGYDPRSYYGDRYSPSDRWVDILAERTGWNVKNQGINGQEVPRRSISIPDKTDLLIVMLGTNDILQGASAADIAARMAMFLHEIPVGKRQILLIAPPVLKAGAWISRQEQLWESSELAQEYRTIADLLGIGFADAGSWEIPLAFDGVHFTEDGHKKFAENISKILQLYDNYQLHL